MIPKKGMRFYHSRVLDLQLYDGNIGRGSMLSYRAVSKMGQIYRAGVMIMRVYFFNPQSTVYMLKGWYWRDTGSLDNDPVGPYSTKEFAVAAVRQYDRHKVERKSHAEEQS